MKRGLRKSQVTVYVIIGLVVVIAALGLVYMKYLRQKAELDRQFFASSDIKPKVTNIQASVIDCSKDTVKNALYVIGIKGGYYNSTPDSYMDLGWVIIPYYYYEGDVNYPSKQDIEKELENFVDDEIKYCLNELDFSGFNVTYNEPKTKVIIKDREVYFNTDLTFEIEREGHKLYYELKDYPVTQNSELDAMLDIASYYTDSHKEDPELYCITCVSEMAEKNNLYVDVINVVDDSTLIVISENHTSPEPYSFEFLNKYTGNERTPEIPQGEPAPSPFGEV
ncbi:hypothetical protein GF386_04590 [Candidatus Pacearchaeota archaeon]|nr:hypothetical protein [Candidatus Pacearchaeota archaeon]MBD3283403.1 hypothetical protein [Candidatus Pacearchaeota archaeon]